MVTENFITGFLMHPTVLLAALLGGSALLLGYIVRLFQNYRPDVIAETEIRGSDKKIPRESSSSKCNKKKPSSEVQGLNNPKWSSRGDKGHNLSPPWLLATLKGHTGPVLDIDYSPNGKYLASCGEEDPDPDPDGMNTSSSDSKSASPMATPSPSSKGLSRRQRKNRRREDSSPDSKKTKKSPADKRQETRPDSAATDKKFVPLRQFVKLNNVSEREFADLLQCHLLTPEQLYASGYPVQAPDLNNAVVFFCHPPPGYVNFYNLYNSPRSKFDVNAREFVPNRKAYSDSSEIDSEESSSSGSEQDLVVYSNSSSNKKKCYTTSFYNGSNNLSDRAVERKCVRCSRGFFITQTEYLTQERCNYHWGKLQYVHKGDKRHGIDSLMQYSCCHGKAGSTGCCQSKLHVWSGVVYGVNGPCQGYVKTRQKRSIPADGNFGVYALDCEMCYTVAGLEVTKITVVSMDGRPIYDSYIKPKNEIVDYNTRFSGITAKDLAKPENTKVLREVQNDLRHFISSDTILIGHGLENDLRALKFIHKNIVDTAWSFPHYSGWPYKRSLRSLVSTCLKREVQSSANGHNSYEDACACMELMLYKVRKENKGYLC